LALRVAQAAEWPTLVDIKSVADESAVKLDADEYLDAVIY